MNELLLAATLVLAPVLADDAPVRLVSDGTGDADVVWYLDGTEVARGPSGEPLVVDLPAGDHLLHATTDHDGDWMVMARLDPTDADSATYVPAWTARYEAPPAAQATPAGIGPASIERPDRAEPVGPPQWLAPAALGVAALGFLLWPERPRRGPEAEDVSKDP